MIRTFSAVLLGSLLSTSCVVAIEADDQPSQAYDIDDSEDHVQEEVQADMPAEVPAASEEPEAPEEPVEIDLEPLEWAVAEAAAGMEKATLSAHISLTESADRVARAGQDLADARAELEHFDAFTAPTELAQRRLSIERSEGRLLEAKAELQQLLDMYADEEFATSSKELVIERGRRGVDFSERSLAMSRASLEDLESFDLAKRRAKLVRGVEKAELGVDLAGRRHEVARMGWDQDERGLVRKLAKAEEALAEAKAKVESGEAVVKE